MSKIVFLNFCVKYSMTDKYSNELHDRLNSLTLYIKRRDTGLQSKYSPQAGYCPFQTHNFSICFMVFIVYQKYAVYRGELAKNDVLTVF